MHVTGKICIRCQYAAFLNPKKEICYKTGGLFCKKLKKVVGKYDACHIGMNNAKKTGPAKRR